MLGAAIVITRPGRKETQATPLSLCCFVWLPRFKSSAVCPISTKKMINYVSFLSRNTNKMQPCNRIYHSKVYWRLNMFRAAHRSSSRALNCICSLWFIYTCGERPLPRLSGKIHSTLATAGHHMGILTRGCKYSLEFLMMSGMALETCWAFNKLWNGKLYYKAASCWYFYWVIYDARIHEYQIRIIYWKTLQRPTFSFLKVGSNNMNRLCEFVNGTSAAYLSILKSCIAMFSLC